MNLTSRVLTVAAVMLAAGTASAATFTFTNTLGNGLWYSEGQSGGTWFNNWGQSGPGSGLLTPGAADTANLAGSVNGNGIITVAALNNPAAGAFTFTGSTLVATTFTNNGTFGFNGGNKGLSGVWTNTASGTMTWGDGAGWSQDASGMSVANAGTLNLPGSATIAGGTWSNAGTMNKNAGGGITINSPVISATSGMIMSSSGSLVANSPTVTSFPAATWVTAAGTLLRLSSPTLSGTFVGNHNGLGAIAGNPSLVGNTTFSNTGAGTQPWVREAGTFTTNAFALTNTGNIVLGGGNHGFNGTYNNAGTVTMDPSGWSYNLGANSALNNTGTVVLSGSHTITATNATSVINNSGALTKANGGTTTYGNFGTLNNNAGGSVNAPNGAITLNSIAINSSPSATWSSANTGAVAMNSPTLTGTFNGTGARFDVNSPTFASNTTFVGTAGGQWNLRDGVNLAGFTITNTGSAGFSTNGGNVSAANGLLVNASGATWAVSNGAGWSLNYDNVAWTNNGLVTADGSATLSRGTNPFTLTNNGTIRRDASGTLTINSAAVANSGTISHVAASNSSTTFNGGTFFSAPPSSIVIPSGVINFNSVSMAGTFNANLNGGSGNMNNPTLTGNTTLNATGAQPWNVTGAINTGAFALTNIAQSGLSFTGGNITITGVVSNSATGTMLMSNGGGWGFTLDNGTLNNAGTMNFPGSLQIAKGTNAATFNSTGTFNRTAGGGLTVTNVASTLAGSVNHDASGSSTNFSGGSVLSNGANYTIQSGSFGFNGASVSGTFNGSLTGSDSYFNNCTLNGNVTLNTTGTTAWDVRNSITTSGFNWTNNGQMTFSRAGGNTALTGNLVNAATGTLRISNGGGWGFTLSNSTLTNNGTMSAPGSLAFNGSGAASVLANNGTFTHDSGGGLTFTSVTVNNAGLITNAGASTTAFNSSPITQTGPGVVRTPTGTRTNFNSTAVSGGRVEGTGNIGGNGLTLNGARLAPGDVSTPSVGTLTCDGGNVTFGPGSILEIDVDRPTGNPPQVADQFRTTSFNQTVNLNNATLNVRLPASYTPNFNVEHVIVDVTGGGTLTGTFASVTEANPLPGYGYRLRYTPTQVIMKVVRQCNLSDVSGPNQVPLFDGAATADDIIVFLGWYFAGDLRADFAGANQTPGPNGQLTADDIIVFLGLYFQGCGF